MPYTIITIQPDQWADFRDIRLRMLADTPIAYGETLEHAQSVTDEGWRVRLARATQPDRTAVAAVDDDGQWVGTMSAYLSEPRVATLAACWVAPEHRGSRTGLADRLLDAVATWARDTARATTLELSVHEQNERAQAYFERAGFRATGATQSYELEPGGALRIMQREL